MKSAVIICAIFLLSLTLLISGCGQSAMQENGMQEKSAEGSAGQESEAQAPPEPAKEIELENNGLKVKIYPTEGKKIKGIITVKFESIPDGTTKSLVSVAPQGFHGDLYSNPNVIVEWIDEPTAGKEVLLDTSKLEGGVYGIGVTTTYEGAPEDNPWSAVVQTQVIVES